MIQLVRSQREVIDHCIKQAFRRRVLYAMRLIDVLKSPNGMKLIRIHRLWNCKN